MDYRLQLDLRWRPLWTGTRVASGYDCCHPCWHPVLPEARAGFNVSDSSYFPILFSARRKVDHFWIFFILDGIPTFYTAGYTGELSCTRYSGSFLPSCHIHFLVFFHAFQKKITAPSSEAFAFQSSFYLLHHPTFYLILLTLLGHIWSTAFGGIHRNTVVLYVHLSPILPFFCMVVFTMGLQLYSSRKAPSF